MTAGTANMINNSTSQLQPTHLPSKSSILNNIIFRDVSPTDLPDIYALEQSSYPKDEAASKSQLQYRQHHAAAFFRCAVYISSTISNNNSDSNIDIHHESDTRDSVTDNENLDRHRDYSFHETSEKVIGFITATRCSSFTAKSMSTHDPNGNMLAIHSVVVHKDFQKLGVGNAMVKDYLTYINNLMEEKVLTNTSIIRGKMIEKIILLSKLNNIPFYVKLGFQVLGRSQIVHGAEHWYDCIQSIDIVEKILSQQKENEAFVKKYGSSGNSLCWIVDSFAMPNIIKVTKKSLSDDTSSMSTQHTVSHNQPTETYHVVSYKQGSGNPAAVVLVPPNVGKQKNHHHQLSTDSIGSALFTAAGATTTASIQSTTSDSQIVCNQNHLQCFDPKFDENINWMRNIATEFNLSETAFIWKDQDSDIEKHSDGNVHYCIRFYTCNGTEVDLCGHATLAAATVIFNYTDSDFKDDIDGITFHAKNNVTLKAKLRGGISSILGSMNNITNNNSHTLKIVMEFPTKPLYEFTKGTDEYSKVICLLKEAFFYSNMDNDIKDTTFNIQNHVNFVGIDDNHDDIMIDLSTEAFLKVPRYIEDINFKPIMALNGYNRGIILCCSVSDDHKLNGEMADFMSRFFGPKVGIEEDPVTGSAHCILGPYFSSKLGKNFVIGTQKSIRGGMVECEIIGNGSTMQISGAAVTIMSGNLFL